MASWFTKFTQNTAEAIGKAIPNEFSKVASVLKYVPYVGQAMQILGAVDSATTGYSDVKDRGGSNSQALQAGFQGGVQVASGGAQDPGRYGSPNVNRDPWNMVGQTGNYLSFNGSTVSPNMGGFIGLTQKDNPYFFKSTDKKNVENWYANQNATGSPYGNGTPIRASDVYANPALNAYVANKMGLNIPWEDILKKMKGMPTVNAGYSPMPGQSLSQYTGGI